MVCYRSSEGRRTRQRRVFVLPGLTHRWNVRSKRRRKRVVAVRERRGPCSPLYDG